MAKARPAGELMQVAQRAGAAPQAVHDDSGVIDLRALMASMQGAPAGEPQASRGGAELTPIPVVSNIPVFPLGEPAAPEVPPPPPSVEVAPPRVRPRTAALLALGGVILMAVAMAITLARTPREAAPAASTAVSTLSTLQAAQPVSAAPAPHPASPESTPVASASPEAARPAEGTAPAATAEKASPPPSAAPIRPKPGVAKKPAPTATTQPAAAAATAPPPPADTCNGDLLCAMKRATKGK